MEETLKNYYGIPYDEIPSSGLIGPEAFVNVVSYFEENIEDFKLILLNNNTNPKNNLSNELHIFVEWLKHLPEPFIPSSSLTLFLENPSIISAQKVTQSLPFNKRTTFSKFIRILQTIIDSSINPISFDSIFGYPFTHTYSCSFFYFLTKQNCNAFCFPYLQIKTFIPIQHYSEPKIDEYNTLGITKEVSDLYDEIKQQAKDIGINDKNINNVELIPYHKSETLKNDLKRILKRFEQEFEIKTQRKCQKKDKIALSSLYKLHMKLRKEFYVNTRINYLNNKKKTLQNNINSSEVFLSKEQKNEYENIQNELLVLTKKFNK